jgi:succinate dehydrogenase flavin-adding protein (antitoxin of CptAB toxin-antitoxin module)
MKLSQLSTKPSMKKLNKVMESRFGFQIDYDSLSVPKAEKMRNKIMETVSSIRNSSAIHTAEKNPQYVEMLIVYEGLSRYLDAEKTRLTEGELGQAEAMLAAKDMVDSLQDMIEKAGKMQNEQLPALVDSIRDQIGTAEADTFKNSVAQLLSTLSQQLGQSRDQLDTATRTLSGEQSAPMGDQMGGTPGMDGMPAPEGDMGADTGIDMPEGPMAGGDAGRELR